MEKNLIQKAKKLATKLHEGQTRKEGIPYIIHPRGVVNILKYQGITDETILSVAWLHDVLEETSISYEKLKNKFGKTIADKVYLLSRNVDRKEYKIRIKNSDYIVKLVKIADTFHNIQDPYSLSYLPEKSIQRKIEDCRSFYIPLAMEVCPSIGYGLKYSIDNYVRIYGGIKKWKNL